MTNSFSKTDTLLHDGFNWTVGECYYNAHYEYGGKKHTDKDYKARPLDSHCWLEDDDGNVYDYFFNNYNEIAMIWTKKGIMSPQVIEKAPKDRLRLFGLDYIPASAKAQRTVLDSAIEVYRGRSGWWSKMMGLNDLDLSVF
jgi:hypothetical protein